MIRSVLDSLVNANMKFNYSAPAEFFISKPRAGSRTRMKYRRFATAAEAIRFAVEDFPAVRTLGAWMQVDGSINELISA